MAKGGKEKTGAKGKRKSKSTIRKSAAGSNVLGDVTVGNDIDESATAVDIPSLAPVPSRSEMDGEFTDEGTPESGQDGPDKSRKSVTTGGGKGRFIFKNLWEVCCNETEAEIKEIDALLKRIGLPSVSYSKKKSYEVTDYEVAPDLETSKSKDFLDFWIFPTLLPAIRELIQFARKHRVFQTRFCTFNAIDFIVEYLYNNNPRYPERVLNPTPIFEISFCKTWIEKHPRTPPPKWMLMSSEEAAVIIQRVVRGYMVRCRPEVQEMRQFWRDYRQDMEDVRRQYKLEQKRSQDRSTSPEEDYEDEEEDSPDTEQPPEPKQKTHHSEDCIYCEAFRNFLAIQPEELIKSYTRKTSTLISDDGGAEKRSSQALFRESVAGGPSESLEGEEAEASATKEIQGLEAGSLAPSQSTLMKRNGNK